jgi:hypothetical protein
MLSAPGQLLLFFLRLLGELQLLLFSYPGRQPVLLQLLLLPPLVLSLRAGKRQLSSMLWLFRM